MLKLKCAISAEEFEVSPEEQALRKRLGLPLPQVAPAYIFRELLSFWQHFAMHRRKCDLSGRQIISVYDQNCPYPVWHRDEWLKAANPPQGSYDLTRPFFEQLWQLFQRCPIAHNVGLGNENCEYSDDWWYSRNCYLCHSGFDCEDCYYCYRTLSCKDCQYCIFSNKCELSRDLLNCVDCHRVNYSFHSRMCSDSYFLFDCRNCQNCLFCWNLRNKQYCIENEQLSKEEYEQRLKEWDLSSRKAYQSAQEHFESLIQTRAYWKNLDLENCFECRGNYLQYSKNCWDCFFAIELKDVARFMRGAWLKDVVECVGAYHCELLYCSCLPQDHCYDIRFCHNVMQSSFLEYCAHCYNCKNCFGCCGLVNAECCIFNKKYSPTEYKNELKRIKDHLLNGSEYGRFFPGYFAANSYDESLAAYYFPLTHEEQRRLGFRVNADEPRNQGSALPSAQIPDKLSSSGANLLQQAFWDEFAKRPFQIMAFDVEFAQKTNSPLPEMYYIRRIRDLFTWMFFDGTLRKTRCAHSNQEILTNLPLSLDKRILSEQSYLDSVL